MPVSQEAWPLPVTSIDSFSYADLSLDAALEDLARFESTHDIPVSRFNSTCSPVALFSTSQNGKEILWNVLAFRLRARKSLPDIHQVRA
jgi:hypothetical protein